MKIARGILFALLPSCAFSADGSTDSIAHIVAARMSTAIGQTVVVENSTGAGGTIGVGRIAKGTPDGYLIGIGHIGTPAHVSAVYFQNVIGAKPQIVHYRGAAPAMQDLLAGQIELNFDQAANSLPQVRAGKVRAYAVPAKPRLTAAPDIPTTDEAGLPNFYMAVWHGIWAPKATPRPIIDKINASIVEALADPGVRTKLADLGQEIPPREQQTPEALRAHHKAEIEKWWPIVKQAGIKVE